MHAKFGQTCSTMPEALDVWETGVVLLIVLQFLQML